MSFATLVWWGCTSVYIVFAFFGNRNWYAANVLFFIFFSSCIGDWLREREFKNVSRKIMLFIGGYVIVFILFAFFHYKETARFIRSTINRGVFYENTAYWMRDNIPPGETIYHPFWADSTYFICLNPQDNYLVVLDPIYMFAYSPETYKLYKDLKNGRIDNPYEVINKTFKVKYGFVPERAKKLYNTIKQDKVHFKIIYNDKRGIVFEILKKEKGV
jgi:hypothetical protein